MKKIMLIILLSILSAGLVVFLFLQQSKFGKQSSGERLERIKKSPNYKNGSFRNISPTPVFAEGYNSWQIGKEFMFVKNKNGSPEGEIPSVKTDLINLDKKKDILVWFGHSSYFMQIDGKRILVDPVFSGHASPFSFSIKAFRGSDIYTTDDMPYIDYLILSHDHWDHLDYETLTRLRSKVKKVFCGLGTGAHLEYWGYEKNIITEMDWYENTTPDTGFTLFSLPSRHFSGRLFKRNQTLWTSFVLKSPNSQIFMGCDGGYDRHFAEIGKTFGGFDLAILENGQYNKAWRYIHTLPEEFLNVAKELNAKKVLPVHSGKFKLANHSWDEPFIRITEYNSDGAISLVTPMIGEPVNIRDSTQTFLKWWEGVDKKN
jgi:L-ascorbate metabolism protein UlaG (beta-lactamase superfamily)